MPILNEFKKWLDAKVDKVPPKSLLGKAMGYTLGQWHRLILYAEDGRVGPDNNVVLSSFLENPQDRVKAA